MAKEPPKPNPNKSLKKKMIQNIKNSDAAVIVTADKDHLHVNYNGSLEVLSKSIAYAYTHDLKFKAIIDNASVVATILAKDKAKKLKKKIITLPSIITPNGKKG